MPHLKLALLISTVFGAVACGESRDQVGKNNPGGASGIVTGSGGGSGMAGSGGQISSGGRAGSGGAAGIPGTTGISSGGLGSGGAGGATASKGGTTVAGASGSRNGGSSGSRDGGAGDGPSDTARDSGICPEGWVWCTDCTGSGSCGPPGTACTGNVCPELDAGSSVDVASGACSKLTTQSACEARRDCHAIFADANTCGCATPGCCMRFSRCADGQPDCTKPVQPSCAIPEMTCPSPYQLSYRGGCPSGCVLASACLQVVDAGLDAGSFACTFVSGDYRTCVQQLRTKLDEALACTPGAANQCSQRISDGCCPRAVNNASAPAVACYLEVRAQSTSCALCNPEPCPTVLGECHAEDGGVAKCR